MNCQRFRKLISSALDGELDEAIRTEFEAHRSACRACSKDFNRERRIRLYLRYLPTVKKVSDEFSREVIEILRQGAQPKAYRINLIGILATFSMIALVLIGVLFAIRAYHGYIFRKQIFIATFEDSRAIRYPGERAVPATGGVLERSPANSEPIYVLNLRELSAENFVLRLLAKYQENGVGQSLVESILVRTGVLDGVRMRIEEQTFLEPITGQPKRIEVIFPKRLFPVLTAEVSGRELKELRQFALDLTSTFGIYVPVVGTEDGLRLGSRKVPGNGKMIDLVQSELSAPEVIDDKRYFVLILFEEVGEEKPKEPK